MHAVRRTLLEAQAERLGLPLHVVEIPSPCPNDVYEARMTAAMAAAQRRRHRARSSSATCFSRMCARTGSATWPRPASHPCSRSGVARPRRWPATCSPSASAPCSPASTRGAPVRVRRTRLRRDAARRSPRRRRPVRRTRRVPHVRVGRPRLQLADRHRDRRDRAPRRFRLPRRRRGGGAVDDALTGTPDTGTGAGSGGGVGAGSGSGAVSAPVPARAPGSAWDPARERPPKARVGGARRLAGADAMVSPAGTAGSRSCATTPAAPPPRRGCRADPLRSRTRGRGPDTPRT